MRLPLLLLLFTGLASAQELAARDPTVAGHHNTVDTHQWNAPAGIGDKYFRLHKEDSHAAESMAKRAQDKTITASALIERLHQQGKLGIAGELTEEVDLRAVIVFQPETTREEARQILEEQPEIKSGALRAEYHSWWCAAHVWPWEE